ncbi:hypothetical protein TruAng_009983 [Truncatella angustata]|nr:hypothetical protein TruAng_009983 [Truncatella angustata]
MARPTVISILPLTTLQCIADDTNLPEISQDPEGYNDLALGDAGYHALPRRQLLPRNSYERHKGLSDDNTYDEDDLKAAQTSLDDEDKHLLLGNHPCNYCALRDSELICSPTPGAGGQKSWVCAGALQAFIYPTS